MLQTSLFREERLRSVMLLGILGCSVELSDIFNQVIFQIMALLSVLAVGLVIGI